MFVDDFSPGSVTSTSLLAVSGGEGKGGKELFFMYCTQTCGEYVGSSPSGQRVASIVEMGHYINDNTRKECPCILLATMTFPEKGPTPLLFLARI